MRDWKAITFGAFVGLTFWVVVWAGKHSPDACVPSPSIHAVTP